MRTKQRRAGERTRPALRGDVACCESWLPYWTAQVAYATERVHTDDRCWEHAGQAVVSLTPTPWGTSEPLSCDGFVSHLPRLPVIPTQRHHLRADSQPEPHLLSALARGCMAQRKRAISTQRKKNSCSNWWVQFFNNLLTQRRQVSQLALRLVLC